MSLPPLAGGPVCAAWWDLYLWQKQCSDKREKSGTGCENWLPRFYGLQSKWVSVPGCLCAAAHVFVDRFDLFCVSPVSRSPVLERSNNTLKFNIPPWNKEIVKVCAVTADGRHYCNATIRYNSQPTCVEFQPDVSWSR